MARAANSSGETASRHGKGRGSCASRDFPTLTQARKQVKPRGPAPHRISVAWRGQKWRRPCWNRPGLDGRQNGGTVATRNRYIIDWLPGMESAGNRLGHQEPSDVASGRAGYRASLAAEFCDAPAFQFWKAGAFRSTVRWKQGSKIVRLGNAGPRLRIQLQPGLEATLGCQVHSGPGCGIDSPDCGAETGLCRRQYRTNCSQYKLGRRL